MFDFIYNTFVAWVPCFELLLPVFASVLLVSIQTIIYRLVKLHKG